LGFYAHKFTFFPNFLGATDYLPGQAFRYSPTQGHISFGWLGKRIPAYPLITPVPRLSGKKIPPRPVLEPQLDVPFLDSGILRIPSRMVY